MAEILYVSVKQIKSRLAGKVSFTDDPETEPDKMSNSLLRTLIEEAEAEVEQDLSPRYFIPFQTIAGGSFSTLPRSTRKMILTLCEIQCILKVLETDYGSGTAINGENYGKNIEKRYSNLLNKLMKRRKDSFNMWFYPPLLDLKLNYHNSEADDGYAGAIHVTSQGDGGFPAKQINDPSENFWNGILDE